MTGKIFITGQIGNTYDEDGNILVKGVELIDVVEQVAALGDVTDIDVEINSPGGYVDVGEDISNFVGSLPNCTTIAKEECASIATHIHLSQPLQNRKIVQGTDYVIHNPFVVGATGDAEELQAITDDIKKTEEGLISMYSKATGVSKEAISGLMKIETSLTPEQCISMKFACEIIPKEHTRSVAMIYKPKEKEMSKPSFKERLAASVAKLAGTYVDPNKDRKLLAMVMESDKGKLETIYDDVQVGDTVMLDGSPAPSDTYTMPDGMVVIVVDGIITEIVEAQNDPNPMDLLNKKVDDLTAELALLKSEKEASDSIAEEALNQLEDLANKRSSGVPPVQNFNGRKPVEKPVAKTASEVRAERLASYKQKK